jgi:hypothetical protein
MSTWFFPKEPEKCLTALRSRSEIVSETPSVQGYTARITFEAYDGRRYVGWSDVRLDEEEKRWIMKYS